MRGLGRRRARWRGAPAVGGVGGIAGVQLRDHVQQVAGAPHDARPAPAPLRPRCRAAAPAARPRRRSCSARLMASAPRTGRSSPDERQLAGELVAAPGARASIWPLAARMPSAIGRSKRPESLGRSAGARLTVMRLLCGKSRPQVSSGRAHALACFLHLGVGQADQREAGQAVGQVHFDRDALGGKPDQGAALHQGQAHGALHPGSGAPGIHAHAVPAWARTRTVRSPRDPCEAGHLVTALPLRWRVL